MLQAAACKAANACNNVDSAIQRDYVIILHEVPIIVLYPHSDEDAIVVPLVNIFESMDRYIAINVSIRIQMSYGENFVFLLSETQILCTTQ